MKLSEKEFKAMNNPFREFLQRRYELPHFRKMGLTEHPGSILEIGCGSGYGAFLLHELKPSSYIGVDVMEEQIALARKRELPNASFYLQDAANLSNIDDDSIDVVVIFGVLHHIPKWREVVQECYRVLKVGGKLFVEEPDAALLNWFERLFHWGHPELPAFSLKNLRAQLVRAGFAIQQRKWFFGFGNYAIVK